MHLECPTKQNNNKLKLLSHECEKNASLPSNKSSKVDRLLEFLQLMLKSSFKEEICLFHYLSYRNTMFRFSSL